MVFDHSEIFMLDLLKFDLYLDRYEMIISVFILKIIIIMFIRLRI